MLASRRGLPCIRLVAEVEESLSEEYKRKGSLIQSGEHVGLPREERQDGCQLHRELLLLSNGFCCIDSHSWTGLLTVHTSAKSGKTSG